LEGDGDDKSGPAPTTPTGHDLRTIEIEGAPWFCGADVLNILYGQAQGKAQMYRQIRADEKRKVTHADLSYHNKPEWIVSESGLYKLIMRSDKDTARPFQDWVTKGGRGGVDPPSSLTAHAVIVRFSDGAP